MNPLWQVLAQAKTRHAHIVFQGDIYVAMLTVFSCSIVSVLQDGGEATDGLLPLVLLMAWMPFIVGMIAVFLTVPMVTSDQFQLILLTSMDDWTIVTSFVWATFHRFRVFSKIAFICTPALMMSVAVYYGAIRVTPTPLWQATVVAVSTIGGIWSLTFMAVGLGVALSIVFRSRLLVLVVVEASIGGAYIMAFVGLLLLPTPIVGILWVTLPLVIPLLLLPWSATTLRRA